MPKQREPIALIEAKGKKHLTKKEKEQRRKSEVKPTTNEIAPPAFLTQEQKRRFLKIASQLLAIQIMGDTDVDALGRYVVAETLFESSTKVLREIQEDRPKRADYISASEYLKDLALWEATAESSSKRQDRYFKQAQAAARELGLTISSRCRIQIPQAPDEPANKFDRFAKTKITVADE